MTKSEHLRLQHLTKSLFALGFAVDEVDQLRKISNTLRRWLEHECGSDAGAIERDENGKPFFRNNHGRCWPVPDLERGAEKRLAAILSARNEREAVQLAAYIQTDPRGAALYILRPGDVPDTEDVGAFYSRGICVY